MRYRSAVLAAAVVLLVVGVILGMCDSCGILRGVAMTLVAGGIGVAVGSLVFRLLRSYVTRTPELGWLTALVSCAIALCLTSLMSYCYVFYIFTPTPRDGLMFLGGAITLGMFSVPMAGVFGCGVGQRSFD